jgi:methanogen homocitrate synthase
MFATHPQITGRKGKIVLGKKSGKPSIVYKLKELGLGELSDEAMAEVLAEVKRKGNEARGLLSDAEFSAIVAAQRLKEEK